MKKGTFLGVVAALLVVAGAFPVASFAADKKITIGYSNIADSDVFCKKVRDYFGKIAQDSNKAEMIFTDAMLDNMKQLDQIDNFIIQDVDGIVLVPVDSAGIVPGIEKANAAGIPVLCLVINAEGGDYTYVGSPSVEAGELQGKYMREHLPQNAKILYLQGTLGLSHTRERWEGFKKGCLDQRPDIELLSAQSGNYERDQGMKIAEDWIQTFPEFDAIVSANDQMALGAVQALNIADRLDGIYITGIDGVDDALENVKNGVMSQTILYNGPEVAKAGFDTMTRIISGEKFPQINFVPFVSVTKDNVDQYLP